VRARLMLLLFASFSIGGVLDLLAVAFSVWPRERGILSSPLKEAKGEAKKKDRVNGM
jgi:hypothetical protein